MQNLRLSENEIDAIKVIFTQYFLKSDKLWLFGSRVDLNAKGGDIDLYAESDYHSAKEVLDAKYEFLADLQMKIGEQKIDLVIKFNDYDLPIYHVARKTGVRLV